MEKKFQKSLILTNIINILLAVVDISEYVLMISLVILFQKYRRSAHRHWYINPKLNLRLFQNLKNHDSHLIIQELGKFDNKISFISNGLEKYMSFTIDNMLSFIDSFQFISSSLDSLVKNLNKDGFTYLSQEFDNKKLHLVK